MKRVDKPWGYELIWSHTDKYAGKVLHVNAGSRLSLQAHRAKEESLLLYAGKARFTIENEAGELEIREMDSGEAIHVRPGMRHRIEAVDDCDFFEVSTPELDDVIRYEDDFGRGSGD